MRKVVGSRIHSRNCPGISVNPRLHRTLHVSDAAHVYPKPGQRTICVKVVDVFGCDTSITVEVKV